MKLPLCVVNGFRLFMVKVLPVYKHHAE